jgi:hypothetical protein
MVKIVDVETKETQTKNSNVLNESINNASFNSNIFEKTTTNQQNMSTMNFIIDELKIDVQIKENLIESINDNLVLKEAEIARLKTRIGILERQQNHHVLF